MKHLPSRLCFLVMGVALCRGPAVEAVTPDARLDPAGTLQRIRTAQLDFEGAVTVRQRVLPIQEGRFSMREGILIAAGGRSRAPAEFLFLGEGEFYLHPADPVEAGQVRLFSGARVLRTPVTEAVLVLTEGEAVEALYQQAPPAEAVQQIRDRAEKLYASWKESYERRWTHVEARLLEAAVGGPAAEGFLGIWCRTREHGDLLYRRDPGMDLQLALFHYVPPDEDAQDEEAHRQEIEEKQREGRLVRVKYEDLGEMDAWYKDSLRESTGRPVPGGVAYEPTHYQIDARLTPSKGRIAGKATVKIELLRDAVRALRFRLYPDLEVQSIHDAEGRELFHARSLGEVIAVLEVPGHRGQKLDLQITYEGPVLEKVEPGVFLNLAPLTWYPRIGTVDLATYDVTYRWPEGLELVSGGSRRESRLEGDSRVERRVLSRTTGGMMFEIGDFRVQEKDIGGVPVRLAYNRCQHEVSAYTWHELDQTLEEALKAFQRAFGPYPYDELNLATRHSSLSQGQAGMIAFSQALLFEPAAWLSPRGEAARKWVEWRLLRFKILLHELGHQWWGNLIFPATERDLWMFEALAEYSDDLYFYAFLDPDSRYRRLLRQERLENLLQRARNGRPVESLGPVVLGYRLQSSLGGDPAGRVIYDKGAFIFTMLGRYLGEGNLVEMLRTLGKAAAFKRIETATFFRALERMSGQDLGPFVQRFVFGTGIPTVLYEVGGSEGEDGSWKVTVQGRQYEVEPGDQRLRRSPEGGWDVDVRYQDALDPAAAVLPTAYQALVESDPAKGPQGEAGKRRKVEGIILLREPAFRVEVRLPGRPMRLSLNHDMATLGDFLNVTQRPKMSLRQEAKILRSLGKAAEAEAMLLRSLEAPAMSRDEAALTDTGPERLRHKGRREDSQTYEVLANVYLDQDRVDDARRALDRSVALLPKQNRDRFDWFRTLTECRFLVREGRYEKAYRILSRHLQLEFKQEEDETIGDRRRRSKFEKGVRGSGRAYAYLAVAAHFTRHEPVCRRASEEARRMGVVMDLLEAEHGTATAARSPSPKAS